MNYKILIATFGFSALLMLGLLIVVGTLLKWKPMVGPKEKQRSAMLNFIRGLILIVVSLIGLMSALHK